MNVEGFEGFLDSFLMIVLVSLLCFFLFVFLLFSGVCNHFFLMFHICFVRFGLAKIKFVCNYGTCFWQLTWISQMMVWKKWSPLKFRHFLVSMLDFWGVPYEMLLVFLGGGSSISPSLRLIDFLDNFSSSHLQGPEVDLQPRGSGGYPEKSRSSCFNPEKKRADCLCQIFLLVVVGEKILCKFHSFFVCFSQIRTARFIISIFHCSFFGGCRLARDFWDL